MKYVFIIFYFDLTFKSEVMDIDKESSEDELKFKFYDKMTRIQVDMNSILVLTVKMKKYLKIYKTIIYTPGRILR
jgi:hypothetical protein